MVMVEVPPLQVLDYREQQQMFSWGGGGEAWVYPGYHDGHDEGSPTLLTSQVGWGT